jgi:uncharacterized protein YqjF (DUF2071 family)
MSWNDLLFMHWPVEEIALRSLVPADLQIDLFDGEAWLGVIPFVMTDVRPRFIPAVFALGFPELNVRTYVRYKDRAGVWFFSLDAASRLAVWMARRFFQLPYQFARMSASFSGEIVEYRSQRVGEPGVQLLCRYKPVGSPVRFSPGTLESWLTERYCLFAANARGEIFRGDIYHEPWRLQSAEVEIEANRMTSPLGLTLPPVVPLLHFARRLDVVAWPLVRAGASREK